MANYKSSISFGLVNIPIEYNPIIRNNDTSFNQLHKKCLNRIHYKKFCDHCHIEVKENDIIKGYEYEKDKYVTFTKEEITNLQSDLKGTIEIVSFVSHEEIEPYYYEKSYLISPPKKSKAFSLFLEALIKSKKCAIGKTALSSKFYYCILEPCAGNILMSTLYFEEEVYLKDEASAVKFTKEELNLALKLIDHLSGHFKPEEYKDIYQDEIREAIEMKINGEKPKIKKKPKKANIKDLVTSLQKSLEV